MFRTITPKNYHSEDGAHDGPDRASCPVPLADRPFMVNGAQVSDTDGQGQQQGGEDPGAVFRPGLFPEIMIPCNTIWLQPTRTGARPEPPLSRKDYGRNVERVGQCGVDHHCGLRVERVGRCSATVRGRW